MQRAILLGMEARSSPPSYSSYLRWLGDEMDASAMYERVHRVLCRDGQSGSRSANGTSMIWLLVRLLLLLLSPHPKAGPCQFIAR